MRSPLRKWRDMILRKPLHFPPTIDTPMPVGSFDLLPLCGGQIIDGRTFFSSAPPSHPSSILLWMHTNIFCTALSRLLWMCQSIRLGFYAAFVSVCRFIRQTIDALFISMCDSICTIILINLVFMSGTVRCFVGLNAFRVCRFVGTIIGLTFFKMCCTVRKTMRSLFLLVSKLPGLCIPLLCIRSLYSHNSNLRCWSPGRCTAARRKRVFGMHALAVQ